MCGILFSLWIGAMAAPGETNVPDADSLSVRYDPQAPSPMEVAADPDAVRAFLDAFAIADYAVFTEDREHSIRRNDLVPARWLEQPETRLYRFAGRAQPGEFFVFQLGVFAARQPVGPLEVRFEDLAGPAGGLPATAFRCFSLGGIDFMGRPFTKDVSVSKGHVQALWIGAAVPGSARGRYTGRLVIGPRGGMMRTVGLTLDVEGEPVPEHGDLDAWRLSRLRWLDSTIGLDEDAVTRPFTPIRREGRTLHVLGRSLTLDESGLPAAIRSHFTASNARIDPAATLDILAAPLRFVAETSAGPVALEPGKLRFTREQAGGVEWEAVSRGGGLALTVHGLLEFDGYAFLRLRLDADRAIDVTDLRLESAFAPAASTYFMGLGKRGGACPGEVDWTWDASKNQDGFWIGAVNGGLKLRLRGTNYRTPLINAYYHFRELNVPESWGNGGKGGLRMRRGERGAAATAYSGPRTLRPDRPLDFDIELWITPFKPVDTDGQWGHRYFHPHQGVEDANLRDLSRVKAMGANVVNIHHNKEQNPTINYPYFGPSFPLLQQCVEGAHRNGVLVKLYYTTREITSNLPELWAFHSLNGEIIQPGPGPDARPITNRNGPHPWLVEHLRGNFIPAWREVLRGRYNGLLDLAVLTTPDSRLDNFYLEGLDFTVRHAKIDGLYIDDTALGRKSFQRARRILDARRPDARIDMHSWSHFNGHAGYTPSAYQFMGNYPYYNRLWHGEGFHADRQPIDVWLVEMSGLPFGLMGELLDGAMAARWKGMVFGQTPRLGWSGDPRPLWAAWDAFGMAGTEMIGFWDPACPVRTGRADIPATVYRKPGAALVALASWSDQPASVRLEADWKALGQDPAGVTLYAPPIADFQPARLFAPGDAIPVEPGRGWLLIADGKPRTLENILPGRAVESITRHPPLFATRFDNLEGWKAVHSKAAEDALAGGNGLSIRAPANTHSYLERPWPAKARVLLLEADPGTDEGQTWGAGAALVWPDGSCVRVNARIDGRFQLDLNGREQFGGTLEKGRPFTLALSLEPETVVIEAATAFSEGRLLPLFRVPREGGLKETPALLRAGKMGPGASARDHASPGPEGQCTLRSLGLYGDDGP